MLKDCPLIQKMGESRRFKKKDNKRAMIAAWSNSDPSDSESDEEHNANICLMDNEVQEDQRFEYESTDEVHISALYECSKEELINALVNNLKSLCKTYTNEKMVRKILRCLPKNKWGLKFTTIKEAQDLKELELDDLLGKLLTHEIHLKEDDGESSKKGIALKAIQEDCISGEEESNDNDKEAFSLIVRCLKKMGLKKKFNQRGFNSKRSTVKRNQKIVQR